MRKIEIDIEEAKRVFFFLEGANKLLHQPMNYPDSEKIQKFVDGNYQELSALYYDVVWDWLPKDVQKEIEER